MFKNKKMFLEFINGVRNNIYTTAKIRKNTSRTTKYSIKKNWT